MILYIQNRILKFNSFIKLIIIIRCHDEVSSHASFDAADYTMMLVKHHNAQLFL